MSVVTVVAILVLTFDWKFEVEEFMAGFVFKVESESFFEIVFASSNIILYILIGITTVLVIGTHISIFADNADHDRVLHPDLL